MGALPERKKKEAPRELIYLFDIYKEIRFSVTEDNKLSPRDELTFSIINEYMRAMQFDLSPTECGVILRADAVFNKSIQ